MPTWFPSKAYFRPISDPPTIRPVGIGDLKLVKQVLARYEAGEVAHIENVLEGEFRRREHRRLRQLEETITVEKAREEESERDLQSTERFELQTETQTVVKSETKFEAGLSLSAGYGPVQISANTEFGMENTKEQSDRTATTYAKEVSEKAVSRLTEKVREERVARTLQEFEEKNLHEFAAGGQNVCGVYRWVDKYYRAKTVDYGHRLFYQFYVPEPAAFYLKAKASSLAASLPEMPLPPEIEDPDTEDLVPLSPELIQRDNFLAVIKQYNVQDAEAPPPSQTVVSKTISRELRQSEGDSAPEFSLGEECEIPKGYIATEAYGHFSVLRSGDAHFYCNIGRGAGYFAAYGESSHWTYIDPEVEWGHAHTFDRAVNSHDFEYIFPGNDSDQFIPITLTGRNVTSFGLNIDILCELRPEVFQQWEIDTYNAIMSAYQKMLMEFEDKIGAAEVSGTTHWGQNPNINREIEKQELKRSCIYLWSGYDLGSSPGIVEGTAEVGVDSYPEIDRDAAIHNVHAMRFFEEAFEWENMTYELVPYFWGNKENWIDTYTLKSEDPIFEQFLRAGAANVLVPVRPSWSAAVLYYQLTGGLWLGEDVPALLASPSNEEAKLYNDYLDEMVGVEDIPDYELDQAFEISPDDKDSWLVKVPTSLVWLQQDSTLPDNEGD